MDEKSIKILETIIMFGPITGPDILSYLEKSNITMNIKTIYSTIDKWNYLFSHIGDGSMAIIGQKKIGYQLNQSYFSYGQYRFLEDAILSSKLLMGEEKQHLSHMLSLFPKTHHNLKTEGFLYRLTTISKAIRDKKTIKFSYYDYYIVENGKKLGIEKRYRQTGNDSLETYLISPYEIVMNKGQYYVLCYCDKYPDNVTVFRLDRMDKVRTVKNEFFDDLKEIVDYDAKKKQMINMFIGSESIEDIRIKFENEIFKIIIDEFGVNIGLSKDVDGKYVVELKDFAVSEGLINWILMMGDKVEVISPISLKQTIYERLTRILNKYKGGM